MNISARGPTSPDLYGGGGLIGLFLVWLAFNEFILGFVHPRMFGSRPVSSYESFCFTGLTVLFVLIQRPRMFTHSDWTLDAKTVLPALILGYSAATVLTALPPETQTYSAWHAIGSILLVPVVEEMLVRGVFLRSLLARRSTWAATAWVAIPAAVLHSGPLWYDLSFQVMLCFVYIRKRNSLVAACACHMIFNAVVAFPVLSLLPRYHK